MRRALQFAAGMALMAGFGACGDGESTGPGDRVANTNFEASEDFSFTMAVTTQNALVARGINGNVLVFADGAATSVTVDGTKTVKSESVADAQAYLGNLNVNITSTATVISATTQQPANTGGRSLRVDYRITVPPSLRVDIDNLNGNIGVAGIVNNVAVDNLNGNVELDDITGNAGVTLANGNIEIDNLLGSGTAMTTNGNVIGDVVLPLNGTLSLHTTNGNAVLSIPQNTSADLTASLTNGQITVTNLVVNNPVQTPTSLNGTLGAGEGTIDLRTTNGDIDIAGL
jgi:DUF4097 and DUF4098 domain-containing protein YvlB